jgi:YggT family protein
MTLLGTVLTGAIGIYLGILTVRLILSWIPALIRDWEPRGVLLVVAEFVYTLTDPPIRFLSRFLPPVRLGGVRLDLSFTVLYFALLLLLRWIP